MGSARGHSRPSHGTKRRTRPAPSSRGHPGGRQGQALPPQHETPPGSSASPAASSRMSRRSRPHRVARHRSHPVARDTWASWAPKPPICAGVGWSPIEMLAAQISGRSHGPVPVTERDPTRPRRTACRIFAALRAWGAGPAVWRRSPVRGIGHAWSGRLERGSPWLATGSTPTARISQRRQGRGAKPQMMHLGRARAVRQRRQCVRCGDQVRHEGISTARCNARAFWVTESCGTPENPEEAMSAAVYVQTNNPHRKRGSSCSAARRMARLPRWGATPRGGAGRACRTWPRRGHYAS